MKECCKNCTYLIFYDSYLCNHPIVEELKEPQGYIEDIENTQCELYEELEGKFWLYDNSPF